MKLLIQLGTELEGASDFKVFESARASSAIFITTDKDFYQTIPFGVNNKFALCSWLRHFYRKPFIINELVPVN